MPVGVAPYDADGPHMVTGTIAVDGAEPGDILRVDVLGLLTRSPYGFISNRHGLGALPGEFPETEADSGPRRTAPATTTVSASSPRWPSSLVARHGMGRATALAYLSAAADFEVSQVADRVKGVHCMIRRADFATHR